MDQIAPFAGELFLNFQIIGVVPDSFLGYGLAQLQHRFEGREQLRGAAFLCVPVDVLEASQW
jgi:hypothetical protein